MNKESILPLLLDNRQLNKNQEKALDKIFREISRLSIDDRNADDWFILGYSELLEGNGDEAIEAFDRAIAQNAEFEAAFRFRASAWSGEGNHEQALKDISEAIRLDPEYKDAYLERAGIQKASGNNDAALADIEKYLGYEPEDEDARLMKAKIHYDSNRYAEAISELDAIIETNPKSSDALSSRGLAHYFNGDADKALADISKARMIEGGSVVSEFNMGLVMCEIPEKSKEAFRHIEKSFRKNGNLLLLYADEADKNERERLFGKLRSIKSNLEKRRDENFYTRELHDLLERKLIQLDNHLAGEA